MEKLTYVWGLRQFDRESECEKLKERKGSRTKEDLSRQKERTLLPRKQRVLRQVQDEKDTAPAILLLENFAELEQSAEVLNCRKKLK